MMSNLVVFRRSRQQWANAICAAWQNCVESILETGRLLYEAKEDLGHGQFLAMIDADLPFSEDTAQRLMAVCRHPVLSYTAHARYLPPVWYTLYQLSRFESDHLERWIKDGRIHPEMQRRDVVALRQALRREPYEEIIDGGCTVDDLNSLVRRGKRFAVIYADPPWSFKVYSGKGKSRSAERHYDCMSLDDIKALPVSALSLDDCALLLWCVWPELRGALDVIEAWGFTYKTVGFVWVKDNLEAGRIARAGGTLHWGMGYWTRANTEPCLLATRGTPQRRAKDVHQVIMAPVGEHSRKPEETHARIERLLAGPYLELFGRQPMAGWSVWGNQITRGLFHKSIPEFAYGDTGD